MGCRKEAENASELNELLTEACSVLETTAELIVAIVCLWVEGQKCC